MFKLNLDKIISNLVGLGVPGLILLIAISTSGLVGAAAITATLSTFGFGFGMIAGVGVFGFSVIVSKAISKYGFEKIFKGTIKGLLDKGESKESIIIKINKYPISKDLKLKLIDLVNSY